MINLRLYQKFMGKVPDTQGTKLLDTFQEALNFRLKSLLDPSVLNQIGGLPKDIESTVILAQKELQMSLNDLIAVPEQDNWHYMTGEGMPIYTPASFVATALR